MVEHADIFRLHGPDYRTQFGDWMLPSHLRAMHDIARCRTEALGGQLYACKNYNVLPRLRSTQNSCGGVTPHNSYYDSGWAG